MPKSKPWKHNYMKLLLLLLDGGHKVAPNDSLSSSLVKHTVLLF
ncbi:unnamed protein product, partial [Cuscuta epithymum]